MIRFLKLRREAREQRMLADEALAEACESIRKIEDRGGEVTEVSESLRAIRERNHFAEKLEKILRGEQV